MNSSTSGREKTQAVVIRYRLRYSPQSAFAGTRPGSMTKGLESASGDHTSLARSVAVRA